MKTISAMMFLLCGGVVSLSLAPVAVAQLGKVTKKIAVMETVLQVLPEGILVSSDSPFLLVRHPDEKKLVDGDPLNCYAVDSGKTFQYTDTLGATRTVRVYVYSSKRIGKRK